MKISKEEILHIASLANIELKEEEIPSYIKNLEEILNYANVINNVETEELETADAALKECNIFRKDEVKVFEDAKALTDNAPEKEENMFKIPKFL